MEEPDAVDQLEVQRTKLLDEKKHLAQLEREAFAEHARLEEDQLVCVSHLGSSFPLPVTHPSPGPSFPCSRRYLAPTCIHLPSATLARFGTHAAP